jgi:signal transduction histidine kinase
MNFPFVKSAAGTNSLSVAKLLAQAQHGSITMQTSDEKGSTVITVLLPSETNAELKFDVEA